eukprot:gene12986-5347_t
MDGNAEVKASQHAGQRVHICRAQMDGAGDGLVETSDRMELGSVSHLLGLMQDLAGEDGQPSESYQLVQIMEVAVDLTPQVGCETDYV